MTILHLDDEGEDELLYEFDKGCDYVRIYKNDCGFIVEESMCDVRKSTHYTDEFMAIHLTMQYIDEYYPSEGSYCDIISKEYEKLYTISTLKDVPKKYENYKRNKLFKK